MRLKLLGTGNAAGVPLYGCHCNHCITARGRNDLRRGPASALLEIGKKKYLIDAGLINIAEKYPVGELDGIFLTHFHPDHVQGLFHLRWGIGETIPVYCPPDSIGCADLFKHSGILDFKPQKKFTAFELDNLCVVPLPLIHSKVTFGFLFEYRNEKIAYLTDTKGLPPKTIEWLRENPLDLLVIDTSYPPEEDGKGHNNLTETLSIHHQLKPTKTILTHISHDLDIWLTKNHAQLPESVVIPRDGSIVFPCLINE